MTDENRTQWAPPGPGTWVCDRSHTTPGPTMLYRRVVSTHTEPTYRQGMKDYGAAIGSLDMRFVNGHLYRRIVPLIAPDRDNGKVPPAALLWLVTRLHPEFRRREKRAAQVLADKPFLDEVQDWTQRERYEWIDRNRALQAVEPAELDDARLADHLRTLDRSLVAGWIRHHELHRADIGPIGDLLAHAIDWGLDAADVMSLLKGSSPATTSAAAHGAAIADALRSAGVDPGTVNSIDEILAVPAASEALDAYLDLFGWRLVSDYDIEGLTLNELPATAVAIVRAAARAGEGADGFVDPTADTAGDTTSGDTAGHTAGGGAAGDTAAVALEAELRSRSGDPALFDELLASARKAYGVRDDNGPLTWAWPAGLTRRAFLEAGRRLAATDRLRQADHVFELDIHEVAAVLEGATSPSAEEILDRAAARARERALVAPEVLGPPLAEPDLSPLPPSIRRMMGIIVTAVSLLDPEPIDAGAIDPGPDRETGQAAGPSRELSGLGIGTAPYRGVARVVDDASTALDALEPGDVLVTAWTAPSFNAVLSIAGGVVVQEGGLLCHAAVMARELGIPAVVGCADAMTEIADGDLVAIDPQGGRVTVLERGPSAP